MSLPEPRPNLSLELRSLGWLVVMFTAAFLFILWPFMGAVLWAVAIAIVFEPVHARVREQTGQRATLASLLTLALIVLIVILPLILVGSAVVQEAAAAVQKIRGGQVNFGQYLQMVVAALPEWVRNLLDRLGLMNLAALQQQLASLLAGSGQFITTHLLGLGQNTLDFVVALFVMLYLLFFLLRDGRTLSHHIAQTLPLRPEHAQRLLAQFVTVVRATVKGNIVIAVVQGVLGGVAFAVLGLPGALLWGTLMSLLSLLPAVGAALVWGPVAAYMLFTGQVWSAVGLTLWGVLAIGLVDNVLRPILVGRDTRLPDYLVLVTTLGGIAVFGINGFVIGPVIAAMFLVAWNLFASLRRQVQDDTPT
ncbi:MAG: AI-2E family transporter [Ramlibacter sp.]